MKLVKDINKESSNKPQVSDKEAEEAIIKLLVWIGEDPSREGLQETPKRVSHRRAAKTRKRKIVSISDVIVDNQEIQYSLVLYQQRELIFKVVVVQMVMEDWVNYQPQVTAE